MTKSDAEKLKGFCKIIRIDISDLELLKVALTHRSFVNEYRKGKLEHNEKLEFLGDAVLELLVSKYLFDNYPAKAEGELTSFRAATVRTESLFEESERLGYGKFLFMSKGEENTGGRTRPYILANTFEAIIGAIYLDKGLEVVRKFLKRELFYKIPEIVEKRLDIDSKSKLQEISQEVVKETPVYEVVDATGPDHAKKFTARVLIKAKDFGKGSGLSKQEAEQNAAESAIKNWKELLAKYFDID
ncbi:MAG: ribonuclease III [Candidatus Dojkabacteria bacterium]|nr:ribonuclease III [Candidatus Dojkabacteria bacterium]